MVWSINLIAKDKKDFEDLVRELKHIESDDFTKSLSLQKEIDQECDRLHNAINESSDVGLWNEYWNQYKRKKYLETLINETKSNSNGDVTKDDFENIIDKLTRY